MKTYIYADRFFFKGSSSGPGYLAVENGRFGSFTEQKPMGEIVDYSGSWIAPGLVDTHIHGLLGHDVMDNDWDGIAKMSEGLLACGVTSFLPTTLTAPEQELCGVCQIIGKHYKEAPGAKIRGIYFEGPFFTEKHKGAQNTDYMSDPDIDRFDHWQELSGGLIKKIALAPEREHVAEFIQHVVSKGVVVSLGHSDATYEQARQAVSAGATVFVHTYNGMSPLNHRQPGMVGAAMSLRDIFAELICDGHHVHPVAASILMNARGRDHVALITDCMRAGRMPDGNYTLGEFPVVVANGTARLENGSLAGSILQLKDALRHVVEWGIATPEEAVDMATFVPAISCGIDDVCGSIQPGREADFLVLSPQLELQKTYLNGICRYQA